MNQLISRRALRAVGSIRLATQKTRSRASYYATAAVETSSSPTPPPTPSTSSDNKINRIVDDISGLTLLQAADLVSLLKTRLNIQEIAMPVSAAPAAGAATAAAVEDEPAAEVEKPAEKTTFSVKLESYDAAARAKIIKEVKNIIPGINLMDAKKFVESVPKVLKENINKEEAEKLQKLLEELGAKVTLE